MIESVPGAVKRRVGSALTRAGAMIGTLGAVAMLIKLKVVIGRGVQQLPRKLLLRDLTVLCRLLHMMPARHPDIIRPASLRSANVDMSKGTVRASRVI